MITAPEDWKQLTLQGNGALDQGDLARAITAYERARATVLDCFTEWDCADDGLAAVVVSYLDLSEAWVRLGNLAEAANLLCTVHGSLIQAAESPELQAPLRRAALRRLCETSAALMRFQRRWGRRPEVARWLCEGCACMARAADAGAEPGAPRGVLH